MHSIIARKAFYKAAQYTILKGSQSALNYDIQLQEKSCQNMQQPNSHSLNYAQLLWISSLLPYFLELLKSPFHQLVNSTAPSSAQRYILHDDVAI